MRKWETEFNFYDDTVLVEFEVKEEKCVCRFMQFVVNIHFYDDAVSSMMYEPLNSAPLVDLHVERPVDSRSREDIETLFSLTIEISAIEKGVYAYETH